MNMIDRERDFFSQIKHQQGIFNYIFNIDGVISEENGQDVWSNY